MALKIAALKDGPYAVTGDLAELALIGPDGGFIDLSEKSKIFLCRCGASVTKPFCDGTHSKIGFQAAEAAVQA